MNILAIDSSGSSLTLALRKNGETFTFNQDHQVRASQIILSSIDEILSLNNLKIGDIDAILFNKGPASFTGTRVAASVTQAIGYTINIPVIGISSLSLMAFIYHKNCNNTNICCIKKAYGNMLYRGNFSISENKYEPLTEIELCATEDLLFDDSVNYIADNEAIISKFIGKFVDGIITTDACTILDYVDIGFDFGNNFELVKTFPDYANHKVAT